MFKKYRHEKKGVIILPDKMYSPLVSANTQYTNFLDCLEPVFKTVDLFEYTYHIWSLYLLVSCYQVEVAIFTLGSTVLLQSGLLPKNKGSQRSTNSIRRQEMASY